MRYDYTFLCECGWESSPYLKLTECRKDARWHVKEDPRCGIPNPTVFIDQHDHEDEGGQMSGKYWKLENIRKATPAKR